jgi:RimJ/RimL family protein N-acetyltransferase
MTTPLWPLFDLVIRTPRLELRAMREVDMLGLIELSDRGIHDPETMPFAEPWTDAPLPQRHWDSMRFFFRRWSEWTPENWKLSFATYADGELVGTQDLIAAHFLERRVVSSGSWIGQAYQGHGFGKEQRVAVLTLAFDGLGARQAETEAFWDNGASNSVTRWLRYEANGEGVAMRRDVADRLLHYRLTRVRWEERRRRGDLPEIELEGVEAALPLFGLDQPTAAERHA